MATGGKELKPTQYHYGERENIITQQEFESMLVSDSLVKDLRQVAMIQCVGARDEKRSYCGRICCGEAVKNALKLKELNENVEIFIFYRDIRTYGFKEDYYAKAREKGILFIRYEPEKKPEVQIEGERLSVTYYDTLLGMEGEINPDMVVLSTPVVAEGNGTLGKLLKVPTTKDGFFMEAHMKLRPIDFATEGIYLCGLAHYPKFIPESINQAHGAAARAATILSRDTITSSGIVSEVIEEECVGCGVCLEVCPYDAVKLYNTPKGSRARVISAVCKGCGVCGSRCPAGAISSHHFNDSQILSQIMTAFPASENE